MMIAPRRTFFDYAGKRIISHDYSNLEGDAFIEVIEEISAQVDSDVGNERLVLINVTNTVVDKAVMKAFRKMTANASVTVTKAAIYGLTSFQMMFVTFISNFAKTPMKACNSRDEAVDWLVSDE